MKHHKNRLLLLFSFLAVFILLTVPACARELTVTLDANGGIFPASWPKEESQTREVVFNIDDSTGDVTFVNVDITPEKDGMHMLGWSTDKNAKYEQYDYQTFKETDNYKVYMPMDGSIKTLYAIWTKAYFITLDANGGSFGTEKDRYGTRKDITTMTLEFWYNVKHGRNSYRYSVRPDPFIDGDLVHKGYSANKNAKKPEYSTYCDGLKLNASTPTTIYAIYGVEGDKSSDYEEVSDTTDQPSDDKKSGDKKSGEQSNQRPTKLTAQKATFKAKVRTKKYTVTLKSGSSPVKKAILTLTVNGKTYTAKTNAKGKATFKIKNLMKKGKYRAEVKFAGNASFKATRKIVKIVVKK